MKRKKQRKRMEKILARSWQLVEQRDSDGAAAAGKGKALGGKFLVDPRSSTSHVLCLGSIGEKLDSELYRVGRHGWEDFASDLGGVFNRHIRRCVLFVN